MNTIISLEGIDEQDIDYSVEYTYTVDSDYGSDADGQRGEVRVERTITRIEHLNGCLVDPHAAPWNWEECEAILARRRQGEGRR